MDFNQVLAEMSAKPIIASALERLRTGLGSELCYHSLAHTKDVLHDALMFAVTDGILGRDLELIAIAAAYHDIGFLLRLTDNESLGADEAVKAMKSDGAYSPEEIDLVRQMVLDTQVKMTLEGPRQLATTRLSGFLCDADVSNLGRPDFFAKAELVRKEIKLDDKGQFFSGLIIFMSAQRWFTKSAETIRGERKLANLAELKRMVKEKRWD